MPNPTANERVILYRCDLARRYGCEFRTIDRDHANGSLPAGRYRKNKRKPFWYLDEIEAFEKQRPTLRRKMEYAKLPTPHFPNIVQLTLNLPSHGIQQNNETTAH